ncbi:MAG: Bug family tripartite tricarboxylate transporter substrate binding protein [Burkholderiales bacterium]
MLRWVAFILGLVTSLVVAAQAYPVKPIRLVLTLAGTDVLARAGAQRLTEALGQPVVVDLVLGASGSIGAATVARAAPDGYTLMMTSSAQIITRVFLSKNTPYDSVKSFSPIAKVAEAVAVVVVNPALPVGSIGEMINHARRNPGKLSYATSGVGTTHHLSSEMLRQLTSIEWTHVPYKSSAQVINDLMSGEVQIAFSALANLVQFANAGKLRIIAVNGDARFSALSNVPTVAEQLPGYERPPGWVAYFGPAGLPAPMVSRLNEEIVRAMAASELRVKLEAIGFVVSTSTAGELAEMVKRSVTITGKLVKAAGIEAE